jgi:hypothetical protein
MGDEEIAAGNAAQLEQWVGRLTAAGVTPVLLVGLGQRGVHQGQVHVVCDDSMATPRLIEVVRRVLHDLEDNSRC